MQLLKTILSMLYWPPAQFFTTNYMGTKKTISKLRLQLASAIKKVQLKSNLQSIFFGSSGKGRLELFVMEENYCGGGATIIHLYNNCLSRSAGVEFLFQLYRFCERVNENKVFSTSSSCRNESKVTDSIHSLNFILAETLSR